MPFTTTQYAGHEAVLIEAGPVRLVASTSVGPRILALLTEDGANAFAELPDMTLPCPGSQPIHLRGGHRLWAAPEEPRVTYRPDDDPVRVEHIPDGVRLTTPSDAVAGTIRETSITITGPGCVRLDYRVTNTADRPQHLAAWAITMMAPLGRAWLPYIAGEFDAGGFQAQRNIVLWSYTHTDDPRYILSDAAIELRTALVAERGITDSFKVGTSLRRGWLAHWREGVLFVKRAAHDETATYADMGASAQVYSHRTFTELETLGPLTDLAPGQAAHHREDWEVHLVGEAEAERLVTSGDLDRPAALGSAAASGTPAAPGGAAAPGSAPTGRSAGIDTPAS